jgi:hypothetical protein
MELPSASQKGFTKRSMLVAVFWGLGEATLFFLVPDVWTSIAGRTKLKNGLMACLFAGAGALVGGTMMYVWGSADEARAISVVEKVPAISLEMTERANGPLRITPYKIYAVYSSGAGIGYLTFLLVSLPSRLIRFLAVTILSHYALKLLPLFRIKVSPLVVLVAAWVIFYGFYFALLPG